MSTHWRKSPAELVDRFEAAIAGVEGLEPRQMFGYPASFIGGNLTSSLHEDRWIVRLPDEERQACLDAGWAQFEPMAGRPMRGYVVMPAEVANDPDAAGEWVERAASYVRTLPPKASKKR